VVERADELGQPLLVASGVGGQRPGAGREVAHDAEHGALFDIGAGPGADRHDASLELLAAAFADALAQPDRRRRVQGLELVEHARALRDDGVPGDQQHPQR
jgi:hypothetical protein